MIRCYFGVLAFFPKYFIFSSKIIIITIFHLSMKSKSIKLLVTNNNSHRNSVTRNDNFQNLHPPVHQFQNDDRPPLSSEPQHSHQHPLCLSEFQKQSITQNEIKSMFTIRQEQSYEYQSDIGSICLNKKLPESRIDQLSTIKAQHNKENYHINSIGPQNSKFFTSVHFENPNHFCSFGHSRENPSKYGSKLKENQTTGSMNTLQHSFEDSTPNVEAWQEKIQDKNRRLSDGDQEQILQEQMIVLKETESSLKLNKLKLPPFETKLKGNEKIKKGYDILYNCSEEELQEIIKILQKQGIKLVKTSECFTKQGNQKDETEQKGQLNEKKIGSSKKKIKIKMIKPRANRIKRSELSGKQNRIS